MDQNLVTELHLKKKEKEKVKEELHLAASRLLAVGTAALGKDFISKEMEEIAIRRQQTSLSYPEIVLGIKHEIHIFI